MLSAFLSEPISVVLAIAAFFFMVWPGYAVLHLLGLGFERWPWAPFAGPAVTLALWIIALSGTIWAKFTLQQTAVPIWIATLLLTVIGLSLGASSWGKARAAGKAHDHWLWLIVCATVAVPFLVMPASFRFGLANFANSTSADSWSFVAMADYFLTIPREAEGGLSALHQYAAHLMATRNATPAILGFLATGLGGVPVIQALVLFCLIVLFANATALVAFAATVFGGAGAAGAFLVIVGLGWPANILLSGNFDQLLMLPLLPVIAVLAFLAGASHGTVRAAVVIGILAAAAFYVYIELFALALLVAMSVIAAPNVSIRSFISRVVVVCFIALPIAVVLTWPAFDTLLVMLKNQSAITGASVRPGEGYYRGLVSPFDWLGSVWSLGPEHLLGHVFSFGNAIGAILLLVTAVGIWAERKRWSVILALTVITAASFYFAYDQHYSYAVYKIVSVNFWLIGFFAVSGFIWLSGVFPDDVHSRRKMAIVAISGLLTIAGFRLAVAYKVTNFTQNGIQQRNFQEILTVGKIIQKEPILLAVRDSLANEWAVFYLADTPMLIAPYRMYMAQPHVMLFMNRAKAIDPAAIRYIVTDRNDVIRGAVFGSRKIWDGKVYSLWAVEQPEWTVLADVNSPNGLESDNDSYWTWLGGQPTELTIVSGHSGTAALIGKLSPVPRAPMGVAGIRVSVTDALGSREIVVQKIANSIPINLLAGRTTIAIKVEDKPNAAVAAGGDMRLLILRFTDFTIQNLVR